MVQRTGIVELPLHYGACPKWLFGRMVRLSCSIMEIIIFEFGKDKVLERFSDPFFFQSLGCVLGFDYHSSGLTTTVCAALKEAFKNLNQYGIYICGGKGSTSRKTPQEIRSIGESLGKDPEELIYASRIVAKVDNNALQDGFNLYHHSFIFTKEFKWVVIQQGLSRDTSWARRYHWYSEGLTSFVRGPHRGILSDKSFLTLNTVDVEKDRLRALICEVSQRKPEENLKDIKKLEQGIERLPRRHRVLIQDINPKYLEKIFLKTYEKKPQDFESLLFLEGVGAKTIRALALISDLIYGEPISFKDPARFSFTHGGKDGYPYRINRRHYENSLNLLEGVIKKAKMGYTDKLKTLRRLYNFYGGGG